MINEDRYKIFKNLGFDGMYHPNCSCKLHIMKKCEHYKRDVGTKNECQPGYLYVYINDTTAILYDSDKHKNISKIHHRILGVRNA